VRYVGDMCGVRYANNLLKNPATKRLSGKKNVNFKNTKKNSPNRRVEIFVLAKDLHHLGCRKPYK